MAHLLICVTNSTSPNWSEDGYLDHITNDTAHTYTAVSDESGPPGDLSGYDACIIISNDGTAMGTAWRNIDLPLGNFHYSTLDEQSMTNTASLTSYSVTQWNVVNASHAALSGSGLSNGVGTFLSTASSIGLPTKSQVIGDLTVLIEHASNTNLVMAGVIDPGDTLNDSSSSQHRQAIFPNNNDWPNKTADGWAAHDAILDWLLTSPGTAHSDTVTESEGLTDQVSAITTRGWTLTHRFTIGTG